MVLKTALRRVLAAAGADAAEASPEENNEDYREAALASLSRQLLGGGAVAESGISADTADHLRLLRQRLQLAHDHHARKLELDHRRQEAAAAPILSEDALRRATMLAGSLGARYAPINANADLITAALEHKKRAELEATQRCSSGSGGGGRWTLRCLRVAAAEQAAFREVFGCARGPAKGRGGDRSGSAPDLDEVGGGSLRRLLSAQPKGRGAAGEATNNEVTGEPAEEPTAAAAAAAAAALLGEGPEKEKENRGNSCGGAGVGAGAASMGCDADWVANMGAAGAAAAAAAREASARLDSSEEARKHVLTLISSHTAAAAASASAPAPGGVIV